MSGAAWSAPKRRPVACAGLLLAALLPLCLSLIGCQAPGRYDLPDQPTLVMVEDPKLLLGDPFLPGAIAQRVGSDLLEFKSVRQVVSSQKIEDLRARAGKGFAALPIDQIGRECGAAQVIYVHIAEVSADAGPDFYRPQALVRVKVLDAVSGKLLFPDSDQVLPGDDSTGGRSIALSVVRPYRQGSNSRRADLALIHKDLAEQIGVDVGRLFHKYVPPTLLEKDRGMR